jgi:hypothetical protein
MWAAAAVSASFSQGNACFLLSLYLSIKLFEFQTHLQHTEGPLPASAARLERVSGSITHLYDSQAPVVNSACRIASRCGPSAHLANPVTLCHQFLPQTSAQNPGPGLLPTPLSLCSCKWSPCCQKTWAQTSAIFSQSGLGRNPKASLTELSPQYAALCFHTDDIWLKLTLLCHGEVADNCPFLTGR